MPLGPATGALLLLDDDLDLDAEVLSLDVAIAYDAGTHVDTELCEPHFIGLTGRARGKETEESRPVLNLGPRPLAAGGLNEARVGRMARGFLNRGPALFLQYPKQDKNQTNGNHAQSQSKKMWTLVPRGQNQFEFVHSANCLLYTSDAADE